jgi:hypothetical protein
VLALSLQQHHSVVCLRRLREDLEAVEPNLPHHYVPWAVITASSIRASYFTSIFCTPALVACQHHNTHTSTFCIFACPQPILHALMSQQSKAPPGQSRRSQAGGYLPIDDYGMVGNMHTCALVGLDGSVDFMCWWASLQFIIECEWQADYVPGLTLIPHPYSVDCWTRTRADISAFRRRRISFAPLSSSICHCLASCGPGISTKKAL